MASNFGNLVRDIIGGKLFIKNNEVIDKERNLKNIKSAKVGSLRVKNDGSIGGSLKIQGDLCVEGKISGCCLPPVNVQIIGEEPVPTDSVRVFDGTHSSLNELLIPGVNKITTPPNPNVLGRENGNLIFGKREKAGWNSFDLNSSDQNYYSIRKITGSQQVHLEYSPPVSYDYLNEVQPGAQFGLTWSQITQFFLSFGWPNGQNYGNSGLFLQGPDESSEFEIQILDSYFIPTYADGMAGSMYSQTAPLVNASRPTSYNSGLIETATCEYENRDFNKLDYIFELEDRTGCKYELIGPARSTAFLNGVLIQDRYLMLGNTAFQAAPEYSETGSALMELMIQTHSEIPPVRYRDIWTREIKRKEKNHKKDFEAMELSRIDYTNFHLSSPFTGETFTTPKFSDQPLYLGGVVAPGNLVRWPQQFDEPNRVVSRNFQVAPSDSIVLIDPSRFTVTGNTLIDGNVINLKNGTATSDNKFGSYQLHFDVNQQVGDAFVQLAPSVKIQISTNIGTNPVGTIYNDGKIILPEIQIDDTVRYLDIVYHAPGYEGYSSHMKIEKLHFWLPRYPTLVTEQKACIMVLVNGIMVHNWTEICSSYKLNPIKFMSELNMNTFNISNMWIRPLDNFGFVFDSEPVITNDLLTVQMSVNTSTLPSGWSWRYKIVSQSFFDGYDGSVASTVPLSGYQDPSTVSDGETTGISGYNLTVDVSGLDLVNRQYRIYATLLDVQNKPISRLIYNTFGQITDRIFEQGVPYIKLYPGDLTGVNEADKTIYLDRSNNNPCILEPRAVKAPVKLFTELSFQELDELKTAILKVKWNIKKSK